MHLIHLNSAIKSEDFCKDILKSYGLKHQDASREMAVNFIVIGYSCQALFNTM